MTNNHIAVKYAEKNVFEGCIMSTSIKEIPYGTFLHPMELFLMSWSLALTKN